MRIRKINKSIPLVISINLILVYLIDGLTKYGLYHSNVNFLISPNRFLKGIMILFSLSFTYFFLKNNSNTTLKIYLLFAVLLVVTIINYFFYGISLDFLIKYSFFFLISPLFFVNFKDTYWNKYIGLTFKYLVLLNFIFIILGFLIDNQFFKTYYNRFGYNGLLLSPMQSTYFYISSLVIAFKLKQRSFLLINILSSLVIGTKILIGFLFCFLFFYLMIKIKTKTNKILSGIILVLILFISLLLFLKQDLFQDIIKKDGILTAIFSFRNKMLLSTWDYISNNNFNVITGGISLNSHRVELGIIDVFLSFGSIGLLVFLFYFLIIKNYFVNSQLSAFYFFSVLFLLAIGGNFLYYPINCLFFLITMKTLRLSNNHIYSIKN